MVLAKEHDLWAQHAEKMGYLTPAFVTNKRHGTLLLLNVVRQDIARHFLVNRIFKLLLVNILHLSHDFLVEGHVGPVAKHILSIGLLVLILVVPEIEALVHLVRVLWVHAHQVEVADVLGLLRFRHLVKCGVLTDIFL